MTSGSASPTSGWSSCIPDDREQTLAAHDLHNETGRPWSREYRLIANDGRVVWFRDVATLVRDDDGRPQHWLGVQLDITELKAVEDELRAARDELERRVAERTAELEEANALMALEIGERRRAEADLRTAEHRYRLLAEQIPAVTYIWEANRTDDTPAAVLHEPPDRAAARATRSTNGTRPRTSGCPVCTRTTATPSSLPTCVRRARASRSRWSTGTCTRTAASSGSRTRRS